MKTLVQLVVLCLGLSWFGTASATLIGDEVFLSCSHSDGPFTNCEGQGTQSAIVGGGIEFADYFNFQNSLSLDISDSAIWIGFDNGPYCGWFTCDGVGFMSLILESLNWVDMPEGQIIDINLITNMTGVGVLWGPNSVAIQLPETLVENSHFIHIELITSHIPTPAGVLLLASGLLLLSRRRLR